MNKFIIILSIGISLLITNSCNTPGAGKEIIPTKSENHNLIPLSEVPASVLSTFKTKYKNPSDVKWEKAQEDGKPSYKAKWKIDGKKIKAEFAEDGSFIKEKQE